MPRLTGSTPGNGKFITPDYNTAAAAASNITTLNISSHPHLRGPSKNHLAAVSSTDQVTTAEMVSRIKKN